MKLLNVKIKGLTPLLQHRFTEDAEVPPATRKVLVNRGTPRDEAEKFAYKNKEGHFYFPGAAIARLLRESGSNHKLRGSRKSAKFIVPAAVIVVEEAILLTNGDGQLAKDFEVDSRPVTIPSTKGKIMRHRPRFDQWGANFTLRINETILPVDFIEILLNEGGLQIGVGDFRPACGGPFGTFVTTNWEEAK